MSLNPDALTGAVSATRHALDNDVVLVNLDDTLGVLRARGEAHQSFLHAQVTSDVENLAPGRCQPSAWLNPKGQVLVLMHLLKSTDGLDLLIARDQFEAVTRRLRMFVLRAKVELLDVGDTLTRCALMGPRAPEALAHSTGLAPPRPGEIVEYAGVRCAHLHGKFPRIVLLAAPSASEALQQRLGLSLQSSRWWHDAAVRAGEPRLGSGTIERYIPQMLNLDHSGAVSFDKGCYPGQEIVARTQYLGRLKRRLHTGTVVGPAPAPLSAVVSGDGKVGEVVDSAPLDETHSMVLCVSTIGRTTALEVESPDRTQPLTLTDIPSEGNADDV